MTSGVLISGVKRRHEGRGKRDVRALQSLINLGQVIGEPPLILVETEQPLCGDCWNEEQGQRPRRNLVVRVRQQATIGVYRGTDSAITGASVRASSSPFPVRRKTTVVDAKAVSSTSATTAAAHVARAILVDHLQRDRPLPRRPGRSRRPLSLRPACTRPTSDTASENPRAAKPPPRASLPAAQTSRQQTN